jgi:outer membrane protein
LGPLRLAYAQPVRKFAGDRIQKFNFRLERLSNEDTFPVNSRLVLMLAVSVAAPALCQEFKAGFRQHRPHLSSEQARPRRRKPSWSRSSPSREKEMIDLGNTLKTATEKFERDAPTLSDSQRQTRQRQLMDQDREFQRKRREFQEDLNARKNEELNQLGERINKVVKQVAEQEKYDIIVQEAVYINPKHDITDKVIKALNGASK